MDLEKKLEALNRERSLLLAQHSPIENDEWFSYLSDMGSKPERLLTVTPMLSYIDSFNSISELYLHKLREISLIEHPEDYFHLPEKYLFEDRIADIRTKAVLAWEEGSDITPYDMLQQELPIILDQLCVDHKTTYPKSWRKFRPKLEKGCDAYVHVGNIIVEDTKDDIVSVLKNEGVHPKFAEARAQTEVQLMIHYLERVRKKEETLFSEYKSHMLRYFPTPQLMAVGILGFMPHFDFEEYTFDPKCDYPIVNNNLALVYSESK